MALPPRPASQARRCSPAVPSAMVRPCGGCLRPNERRRAGLSQAGRGGHPPAPPLNTEPAAHGPTGVVVLCSALLPSDARRIYANELHCPGLHTVPVPGRLRYHRRAMHCGTRSLVPLPAPAGGALVFLDVKKTKSVFPKANSVALKLLWVGGFFCPKPVVRSWLSIARIS